MEQDAVPNTLSPSSNADTDVPDYIDRLTFLMRHALTGAAMLIIQTAEG